MLRPPYTSYDRLHVYHLDTTAIPAIDDPDLIGVWIEDKTAVLFFHHAKESLVTELCESHRCSLIYQAELDYRDWEAGQVISTFSVAGVTVAPVWETGGADIRLDPGVIFGSGFHPTTRTCLETLVTYLKTPEMHIDTVLDLGTGHRAAQYRGRPFRRGKGHCRGQQPAGLRGRQGQLPAEHGGGSGGGQADGPARRPSSDRGLQSGDRQPVPGPA